MKNYVILNGQKLYDDDDNFDDVKQYDINIGVKPFYDHNQSKDFYLAINEDDDFTSNDDNDFGTPITSKKQVNYHQETNVNKTSQFNNRVEQPLIDDKNEITWFYIENHNGVGSKQINKFIKLESLHSKKILINFLKEINHKDDFGTKNFLKILNQICEDKFSISLKTLLTLEQEVKIDWANNKISVIEQEEINPLLKDIDLQAKSEEHNEDE